MSDEQLKVLEMLQDGNLTPDEALRLLNHMPGDREQLGNGPRCDGRPSHDRHRDNSFHRSRLHRHIYHRRNNLDDLDFSWITNLTDQAVEAAIVFSNYVGKQDLPGVLGGKVHRVNFSSVEIDSEEIKSIRLSGKNDGVEISGYEGETIQVEVSYRQRNGIDPQISFEEDDGCYRLFYDGKALSSLGLLVRVPEKLIGELYVENKNSHIKLSDLSVKKAEVCTKNAPIKLSDVKTENELKLETYNAPIFIDDTTARKMELKTGNAKIFAEDCNADKIKMSTSNAPIATRDCDFRDINAQTSNAGIKIDGLYSSTNQYPVYSVEARTSNGGITVNSDFDEETACQIKASTSVGNIRADCPGLGTSYENGYMNAKSENYDESPWKLNLNLQTSHGSINVRTC